MGAEFPEEFKKIEVPQASVERGEAESEEEVQRGLEYLRKRSLELFEDKVPEGLFVLAGATQVFKPEGQENPRYRSGSYSDVDKSGAIIGNRSRIVAAAELGKLYPDMKLITTSRHANPPEGVPASTAEVMQKELTGKYQIPEGQVLMEEKSTSTMTELIEMLKMVQEQGWHRIGVITNRYHVARVQKMYDYLLEHAPQDDLELQEALKYMKENNFEVVVIPSEEILNAKNAHFYDLERRVMETDEYKKRVEMELNGIRALEEGNYKF